MCKATASRQRPGCSGQRCPTAWARGASMVQRVPFLLSGLPANIELSPGLFREGGEASVFTKALHPRPRPDSPPERMYRSWQRLTIDGERSTI